MKDVIFIGNRTDACLFQAAGVVSFAPAPADLAERVIAERGRCRVLAMTESTFAALPAGLARALREGEWPRLVLVVPDPGRTPSLASQLRARAAREMPGVAA